MSAGAVYVRLDELNGIVGEPAGRALLDVFGGGSLYVAAKPSARIVDAIGLAAAQALSAEFTNGIGGLWIELPNGKGQGSLAGRVAELAERSCREIARELGICERSVRRHRAAIRAATNSRQRAARAAVGTSVRGT